MKQFINKILLLLPVMVIVFSGCKKDEKYTIQTKPVITALSPAQGVVGSTVVIKGSNLKNVNRVRFGKEDAAGFNRANNTDSSVSVQVPAGVFPGDLLLQIYIENGGSTETMFKVYPQPAISLASPATGFPGDNVVITGQNLQIISSVKFGAANAVFTATSTRIETKVPANAAGGAQQISISGPGGTVTAPFTVNLAAQITSLSPGTGAAGTVITVTGVRFTGATAVKIGNTNVPTFNVVSATELKFTIPAGAVTGQVSITTPNGTNASTAALTVLVPGLALPFYNDAITANWNGWIGGGWGGTKDLSNTSPVKSGSFSARIDFVGGYGVPLQLGGATVSLASYTTLKMSVYGGPGSNGKTLNVGFNEADGKSVTIVEGAWTDFVIPLSEISGVSTLTHLYIKNYTPDGGYTVYIDDLGLN